VEGEEGEKAKTQNRRSMQKIKIKINVILDRKSDTNF